MPSQPCAPSISPRTPQSAGLDSSRPIAINLGSDNKRLACDCGGAYPSQSAREPLMDSIDRLSRTLQGVLTTAADRLAQETGVIQRQRKLTGAILLQTLVLGWVSQPAASLTQLTQLAALRGVVMTPQALDRRFTPALVRCMERFLALVATQMCGEAGAEPVAIPLLQRFSGVWILDSTTLS